MGLFDFLKKKNTFDERIKKMPPAFQEAFKSLFPNGGEDHQRQVKELNAHFNNKYSTQEIDNNLIFVLSGYLITGSFTTKEHAINSVLNRKEQKLSKDDAEFLHDYALQNHPKLAARLDIAKIEEMMGSDGCDSDTIPGGYGSFGYTESNPIPTKGVTGIYDYLSRLYDSEYDKVKYSRLGTTNSPVSHHPIDIFQVTCSRGNIKIYFSGYHKRTSQLAPTGLILVDDSGTIISTDVDEKLKGQSIDLQAKPLPKLACLNLFGCFPDKEIADMSDEFKEAEAINRKAIALYNKGDVDNAIIAFDKAISLGSLNAVNNKFTCLHSEERYTEALEHLESIVGTQKATALGLYNLAVLYFNGESDKNYHLHRDIGRTFVLHLEAYNLKDDHREEFRGKARELLEKLFSRLEKEDGFYMSDEETIKALPAL